MMKRLEMNGWELYDKDGCQIIKRARFAQRVWVAISKPLYHNGGWMHGFKALEGILRLHTNGSAMSSH